MSIFHRRHDRPPTPQSDSAALARLDLIADETVELANQLRETVGILRDQAARQGMKGAHEHGPV